VSDICETYQRAGSKGGNFSVEEGTVDVNRTGNVEMPQNREGEVQAGRKGRLIVTQRWLGGSGPDYRFLCWANTDRPLLAADEGIDGEAEPGAFLPGRQAVRVLIAAVFSIVLIPGRFCFLERRSQTSRFGGLLGLP
jgi:hypothetical protein